LLKRSQSFLVPFKSRGFKVLASVVVGINREGLFSLLVELELKEGNALVIVGKSVVGV
jgi:hypothetical protein